MDAFEAGVADCGIEGAGLRWYRRQAERDRASPWYPLFAVITVLLVAVAALPIVVVAFVRGSLDGLAGAQRRLHARVGIRVR